MMKRRNPTRYLVQAGMIAALYVALTYLSNALGLAYGMVQFRLSEALCILPLFTPAAVPGLAVGCIVGNLGSPMGVVDILFGTLATLGARALRQVRVRRLPLLPALMPVLWNAVVVGIELTIWLVPGEAFTLPVFFTNALWVAVGEAAVVYLLGIPLALLLEKRGCTASSLGSKSNICDCRLHPLQAAVLVFRLFV